MMDGIVKQAIPSLIDAIIKLDEGDPELVYCYNKKSIASTTDTENVENGELDGFNIVPMAWRQLCDINKPNQPFKVFGRLIPAFTNWKWTWTEELFETPNEKHNQICRLYHR